MPINVTIDIPDEAVSELSAATGASNKAEFETWVQERLKATVRAYRRKQTEVTETAKVRAAQDALEVAVQAAEDAVDTDIVLG